MARKRVSVCCGAPLKVETWVSKTKRQVLTCTACGLWPAEVRIINLEGGKIERKEKRASRREANSPKA